MTLSPKPLLRLDFAASHVRYKNASGKVLPGVTTVLKLAQNSEALIRWSFEQGRAGKDFSRTRDDAADTGKVAHAMIEAELQGTTVDPGNISGEMWAQASCALKRWQSWWASEELAVVASEHRMVSERMQVGGTADVIAQKPDGSLWLADAKTTPRLYDEAEIQAAVYAEMWHETTNTPIERVYLIRVGKGDEEGDKPEVREVFGRPEKVAAFAALAEARRKLQLAGVKV